MIPDRKRCICANLPKCVGTSVLDWFIGHGGARHSFGPYWYRSMLPKRIQRVARPPGSCPGHFTFTFLRNPYRRFLSLYRAAGRDAGIRAARIPDHPASNGTLREFAELCAGPLADTRNLRVAPATAFFRGSADRRYGPPGNPLRHPEFVFGHARPQTHFPPDCKPERLFGLKRGSPGPLQFVGAVEIVDTDFRQVQEALGLPRLPLPRRNASSGTPPRCAGRGPGQPVSQERPGGTALPSRAACTPASPEIGMEHRLFCNPVPPRRLAPPPRPLRGLA